VVHFFHLVVQTSNQLNGRSCRAQPAALALVVVIKKNSRGFKDASHFLFTSSQLMTQSKNALLLLTRKAVRRQPRPCSPFPFMASKQESSESWILSQALVSINNSGENAERE